MAKSIPREVKVGFRVAMASQPFKQIFFQHAIQYSELMAMSQTYVISSDFGHDIFHGSVDQLIQWTSCLDCLINITLCYMLCYIGPMGPNLPISEIKPFNQLV